MLPAVDRAGYRKSIILSALVLAAYTGAVTRGESLLWVIAALLVATLVTGISWPHWLVRQLAVTRAGPDRVNEGDTITFRIELHNDGRLPRFMVEVVDRLPFLDTDLPTQERVLSVVGYIGGHATRAFAVSARCEKRGLYQLGPVSLASSFPLGLAQARQRKNSAVQTIVVYPQVFPIVSLPLQGTPSQIHRGGFLLPQAAGAAEFCGLREYRRGDNPRHIHWPTSARLNELMVREFEPLASACLSLVLDLATDANVGIGRHATFEYAVKIAASVANYASAKGMPVRLFGEGRRSLITPAAAGEHHYRNLLEQLAIIDSDGAAPYARVLVDVALSCEPGETVMVFLSEPGHRIEQTLQSVAVMRARGLHVLAVSFDRSTFLGQPDGSAHSHERLKATLLELGAAYLDVRNGDDLFRRLNP